MKKKKRRPNPKMPAVFRQEIRLRYIDNQYLPLIWTAIKKKDYETVEALMSRRQQEIYMVKAGVV